MGSRLPIKILKKKSTQIWRYWWLILCQNVKISYYFSEKIPLFIKTKAKVLKAILYKCIYCPLTVYAKIAKVFMKKGTLNNFFKILHFSKKNQNFIFSYFS